jgi:GNAT superfamily N-acetyltransferase
VTLDPSRTSQAPLSSIERLSKDHLLSFFDCGKPREESPARVAKGLARHPIGVILLARLAVDRGEQGTGLGWLLLTDALSRALSAAEAIGARAILVHAIDDEAAAFYKKFGFEPSPLDPRQLLLLMKDLRATLKSIGLP